MKTHTRIGISIPTEMLTEIEKIRNVSNRSKFIVELIRNPLKQKLEEKKGVDSFTNTRRGDF
jgi:metal-responsive CopG/Arc/MetJ family transcriptional regulator